MHHVPRSSGVAAGIALCPQARAAYVTPSHQYPLGMTLSASRRLQLLDWAQQRGAWLLEDDYDSEYRFESLPISALQGLDRDARVIYIGTFSKVLFPSLRLGYIVIPADLFNVAPIRKLCRWGPTKFPSPDHQRRVQQSMSFQVFQQRRNGFVTRLGINAMAVLQPTVLIPPIDTLACRRQ